MIQGISDEIQGPVRVGGSRPDWSLHCHIVSLDKRLCSTLSLFTQVYKWVPTTYYWGNPAMNKRPNQGGRVEIFLVASCYRAPAVWSG